LKLYGALASPYVARVVMAARLKGLAVELAFPPGGGLKSAEFLALNPLGKIPALDDGGRVLVESAVILEYLEEKYPQKPLLPEDLYERARVRTLARFVDLYLAPHASVLLRNMNPATRDAAAVEPAKAALAQGLGHFEPFLVGPYAAGNALTLADCTMLPTFDLVQNRIAPAHGLGDPLAGTPKLAAWWSTMRADAFCAAMLGEIDVAVREFMARMAQQAAAGKA
jgi:glutathione S-transferase